MIEFIKMQGTGNDFVVVDNRDGRIADPAAFARTVCPRGTAVGADGVLLLETAPTEHARMRIINADGSEAEMCGNGARCFARFAHEIGAAPAEMTIRTLAGVIRATVTPEGARVQMTDASMPQRLTDFTSGGVLYPEVWHCNTGVPHAVVPVTDVAAVDVEAQGRAMRQHRQFAPAGTNVNFIMPAGPNTLRIRTYERGVEAETQACGTGATASALAAARIWGYTSPVRLHTQSGSDLVIRFEETANGYSRIFLEGPVVKVYAATLLI